MLQPIERGGEVPRKLRKPDIGRMLDEVRYQQTFELTAHVGMARLQRRRYRLVQSQAQPVVGRTNGADELQRLLRTCEHASVDLGQPVLEFAAAAWQGPSVLHQAPHGAADDLVHQVNIRRQARKQQQGLLVGPQAAAQVSHLARSAQLHQVHHPSNAFSGRPTRR